MIKIREFKCHMCDQVLPGSPKMRVALIGFCWEPTLNEQPHELLDVCEACQYSMLKAYQKAKNERMEAVYEKGRTSWIAEKMKGLERKSNKQPFAVRNMPEVYPSPCLNYRKEQQKTWGF